MSSPWLLNRYWGAVLHEGSYFLVAIVSGILSPTSNNDISINYDITVKKEKCKEKIVDNLLWLSLNWQYVLYIAE